MTSLERIQQIIEAGLAKCNEPEHRRKVGGSVQPAYPLSDALIRERARNIASNILVELETLHEDDGASDDTCPVCGTCRQCQNCCVEKNQ